MQKIQRPLKLPSRSARAQAESKALWNEGRSVSTAAFFTIGYAGRTVAEFVEELITAGVRCLVDIRFTPISRYKPEFSRTNLQRIVEMAGIDYLHTPKLGVPRDIRGKAIAAGSREVIWHWYDQYVVGPFLRRNLHQFMNLNHPVALMCVEADPVECHRHRLFLALEDWGLQGFDL